MSSSGSPVYLAMISGSSPSFFISHGDFDVSLGFSFDSAFSEASGCTFVFGSLNGLMKRDMVLSLRLSF